MFADVRGRPKHLQKQTDSTRFDRDCSAIIGASGAICWYFCWYTVFRRRADTNKNYETEKHAAHRNSRSQCKPNSTIGSMYARDQEINAYVFIPAEHTGVRPAL
jgi:hypothetical protein